MKRILCLVAAIAFTPALARGDVLTWECTFDHSYSEGQRNSETLRLTFVVDTQTGRGFIQGNLGIEEIEVFVGDENVSFIERTASGAVMATTIKPDGDAVHSRNTVMLGDFIAAQHFGTCKLPF